MDWSDCPDTEVIPGKVGGLALLKGTRVPADLIIESLDSGETIEEVAYNYDLSPGDVLRLKLYRDSRHPAALRS